MRALVRETRLSPDNFIYPLFICPGEGQRREVGSMPGAYQLSVDEAVREAAAAKSEGVPGVLLFGLPAEKDVVGSAAHDPEGSVQMAIRAIKQEVPGLLVITDVCLCEYTSHGHCGIIVDDEIAQAPERNRKPLRDEFDHGCVPFRHRCSQQRPHGLGPRGPVPAAMARLPMCILHARGESPASVRLLLARDRFRAGPK